MIEVGQVKEFPVSRDDEPPNSHRNSIQCGMPDPRSIEEKSDCVDAADGEIQRYAYNSLTYCGEDVEGI